MKNIPIILISILLSSCGIFHKVTNKQDSEISVKTNTELRTDSDSSSKTDIKRETITRITETVDTNIVVPGTTVTVARPLTELIEKGTITAQDGAAIVTVNYDPTTGTVRATGKTKEQTIPVKINRTEEVSEDYKSSEDLKTSRETQHKEAIKADQDIEVKDVEKDPSILNIWTGLLIGIILMLLIYLGVQYIKRQTP